MVHRTCGWGYARTRQTLLPDDSDLTPALQIGGPPRKPKNPADSLSWLTDQRIPPPARISWLVTKRASSEARKLTTSAMSLG
jgi:hypothetical protein